MEMEVDTWASLYVISEEQSLPFFSRLRNPNLYRLALYSARIPGKKSILKSPVLFIYLLENSTDYSKVTKIEQKRKKRNSEMVSGHSDGL